MTDTSPRRFSRLVAAPMISVSLIWGTAVGLAGPAGADSDAAKPNSPTLIPTHTARVPRSEERRVGKEC